MNYRTILGAAALLLLPAIGLAQARLSLIHASGVTTFVVPNTSVIFRVNNTATSPLSFGNVAGYQTFSASGDSNSYRIDVLRAVDSALLATTTVTLNAGSDYTAVFTGDAIASALSVSVLNDAQQPVAGRSMLRIFNAVSRTEVGQVQTPQSAPGAVQKTVVAEPRIALLRDDGSAVDSGLNDVPYKGAGTAQSVAPGTYNLKLMDATRQRNLDDIEPFTVSAGQRVLLVVGGNDVVADVRVIAQTGGAAPAREATIDFTFADTWFSLSAARQGFSLFPSVRDDGLAGGWFTYEPNGGAQAWLTVSTCESGAPCTRPGSFRQELGRSNTLFVYRLTGGRFGQLQAPTEAFLGTATITFLSCTTARFTYQLAAPFGSGALDLLRSSPAVPGCATTP
jgi:Domain of unknown function (DUF4397)